MNRISVFLLILIGLFFTSCVPTKDLIYLQKKDKTESKELSLIETKPYQLQVNDILSISIKAIDPKLVAIFSPASTTETSQQHSEQNLYFDGYTIDNHGNIRVPILGDVNVLGLTLDETRIKLEKELLAQYFNKEADIFVNVKLAGFRYTVTGEVGAPGTKTLFKEKVNVLDAIANSGEITIVGDRKHVLIVRQLPGGSEMHELDLTDVNVMKSPNFFLKPNDYIYVKPLKQKSWGTGKTGIETFSTVMLFLSFITTTLLLVQSLN